jgi:hypothetical protein
MDHKIIMSDLVQVWNLSDVGLVAPLQFLLLKRKIPKSGQYHPIVLVNQQNPIHTNTTPEHYTFFY